MKYIVFEAGSRAGFSAEKFFMNYLSLVPNTDDVLYLVDRDEDYCKIPTADKRVIRMPEQEGLALLYGSENTIRIFPADELTRQNNPIAFRNAKDWGYSFVEKWYYNKKVLNHYLKEGYVFYDIHIPFTFEVEDVFIRPNTMSAGSKGVYGLENTCVTEKIDIQREYVVDVFKHKDTLNIYAREVKLRCGYDKMVKFLDDNHKLVKTLKQDLSKSDIPYLFDGVFHLQIAEDRNGVFFFIEASKRISGTSIINLLNGYNPFCAVNGIELKPKHTVAKNTWYRYEDLLLKIAENEK